jgi:hypothetical protein
VNRARGRFLTPAQVGWRRPGAPSTPVLRLGLPYIARFAGCVWSQGGTLFKGLLVSVPCIPASGENKSSDSQPDAERRCSLEFGLRATSIKVSPVSKSRPGAPNLGAGLAPRNAGPSTRPGTPGLAQDDRAWLGFVVSHISGSRCGAAADQVTMRFEVSHPSAMKPPKGWGNQAFKDGAPKFFMTGETA